MSETQRISENARCLDDFLLDVEAANRADATIRFYRDKLESFLKFLAQEGVTTPEAITPPVLRRFLVTIKDGRTSGGAMPSGVRSALLYALWYVKTSLTA